MLQEKLREKSEVDSRLIQMESELCSVRQVIVDQNAQVRIIYCFGYLVVIEEKVVNGS